MIALLAARSILSAPITCPPFPPAQPLIAGLLMAPGELGPGSYHLVAAADTPIAAAAIDEADDVAFFAALTRRLTALCKLGRHLVSGPVLALPARPDTTERPGIHWNHPGFEQLTAAARRDLVPGAVKFLDRIMTFLDGEKANYDLLGQAVVDFDQLVRRIGRDERGFEKRQFPPTAPDAPKTISRPVPSSPAQIPTIRPAAPDNSNRQRAEIFQRLLGAIAHITISIPLGTGHTQGDYRYSLCSGVASGKYGLSVSRSFPPGKQGAKEMHAVFYEGDADQYKIWHIKAEETYTKALAALQKPTTEQLDQKDRRRRQRFEERKALGGR